MITPDQARAMQVRTELARAPRESQPALLFDHVWFWKAKLPERKGQKCAVLIRANRMNSILVQFEDGKQVVTSRYAVRKLNT